MILKKENSRSSMRRDFPGRPVVKTLPCSAEGECSIPGLGARIPHVSGPKNQSIKQKQYCNKFIRDLKKKKSSMIIQGRQERKNTGLGRLPPSPSHPLNCMHAWVLQLNYK